MDLRDNELLEKMQVEIYMNPIGTASARTKLARQLVHLVREHDAKFIDAEEASRIMLGMKDIIRHNVLNEAIAAVDDVPTVRKVRDRFDLILRDAVKEDLQQLRDSHDNR